MNGLQRDRGLRWATCLVFGLAGAACHADRARPRTPADDPGADALPIDGDRMFAVVETLASDGLAGRYTLSPDIRRASSYIASLYEEAGIVPAAQSYEVEFEIPTGAEVVGSPTLHLGRGEAPASVDPDDFIPLAASGSGAVQGEVVFVGYAARSVSDGETSPEYDDLQGIDVRGKIALVLHDAPARPDYRAWFSAIGSELESYETRAAPLRKAGDLDALGKLQGQTRARLADLVRPYLRGVEVPASLTEVPEDPTTPLEMSAVFGAMREVQETLPGPEFDFGESRLSTKLERLVEAGAAGVIVVRGPRSHVTEGERTTDPLPDPSEGLGVEPVSIPVFQLRWPAADQLVKGAGTPVSALQARIDRELQPASRRLEGVTAKMEATLEREGASVPNVLATIPGTDLADEVVLVGAHYDHIGTDEEGRGHCEAITGPEGTKDVICNGADDNASGTAMVLELARAMADAGIRPRRTVVFAHFAGEEIGLLGSEALASRPPETGPLADGRIVAMVNLDMVGRLGQQGLSVGGISSSDAWMPLLERAGTRGMPVLYERAITSRSDHAAFYSKQIPVLFFFTNVHEDYHRAGDEAEKINKKGMQSIAALVSSVLIDVAEGHSLPFRKPATPAEGLVGALPGTNPDTIQKRVPGSA